MEPAEYFDDVCIHRDLRPGRVDSVVLIFHYGVHRVGLPGEIAV